MTDFLIKAPNGKSYQISGETQEGALAALKKHLEAGQPAAASPPPADTPTPKPPVDAPIPQMDTAPIEAPQIGADMALSSLPAGPSQTTMAKTGPQPAAGRDIAAIAAALQAIAPPAAANPFANGAPQELPPNMPMNLYGSGIAPAQARAPGPVAPPAVAPQVALPVDPREALLEAMKGRGQPAQDGMMPAPQSGPLSGFTNGLDQIAQDQAAQQAKDEMTAAVLPQGKTPYTADRLIQDLMMAPRAVGSGLMDVNEGFWNIARAGDELIGAHGLAALDKQFAERAKATSDAIRGPEASTWAGKQVQGAMKSVGGMVPGFAATLATGGAAIPAVVASYLVPGMITQGGQSVGRALDEGKGPGAALLYGAVDATAEGVFEKIPVGRLLKDITEHSGLGQILMYQLVTEVPTEVATTIFQNINEYATLNPEKPFSDFIAEQPVAIRDTIAQTIIAAGAVSGAGAIASKAIKGRKGKDDKPSTETAADQPPTTPEQDIAAAMVPPAPTAAPVTPAPEAAAPVAPVAPPAPPPVEPPSAPIAPAIAPQPPEPPEAPTNGITQAQVDANPDRYEVMGTLEGTGTDVRVVDGQVVQDRETGAILPLIPERQTAPAAPASPQADILATMTGKPADLPASVPTDAPATTPQADLLAAMGGTSDTATGKSAQEAPKAKTATTPQADLVAAMTGKSAAQAAPPVADRPVMPMRSVKADTSVTPTGQKVDVEYAITSLDKLTASNFPDGRINPAYPQERQPRDRTDSKSQMQITDIMAKFDPRQLDQSPTTDNGAMIVDKHGIVESGNGRTMMLNRVYAERPDLAAAYQDHLRAQGYPVDGVKNPVLVRVRRTDMTPEQIGTYTRDSNTDVKLAMSATEQAMADAKALPDSALSLYRGGDLDLAANSDFVRVFQQHAVAPNEQGKMRDGEGRLSQEAVRRIGAALLAKAYGDAALISKLIESTDNNIKSIGGAILDVAPAWAKMRAAAASGAIASEMDQTDALLEAVKLVDRARMEGRNVIEYVKQPDLLSGDGISPMGQRFLALMFKDVRQWTKPSGRDRLVEGLQYFIDAAMKSAPGIDMFGGSADVAEAVDLARKAQDKNETDPAAQGDLLAKAPQRDGGSVRPAEPVGNGPGPQGPVDQGSAVSPAGSGQTAVAATFPDAQAWGSAVIAALKSKVQRTGSVTVSAGRTRAIALTKTDQVDSGLKATATGLSIRTGKRWDALGIVEADALANSLGLPKLFDAVPPVERAEAPSQADMVDAAAADMGKTLTDKVRGQIVMALPNKATEADAKAAVEKHFAQPAPSKPSFPTTLEAIVNGPNGPKQGGRLTHIYAEYRGMRYYLASVSGAPGGPIGEWLKTYPQEGLRILTTDRADLTSINGETGELDAAIKAASKGATVDYPNRKLGMRYAKADAPVNGIGDMSDESLGAVALSNGRIGDVIPKSGGRMPSGTIEGISDKTLMLRAEDGTVKRISAASKGFTDLANELGSLIASSNHIGPERLGSLLDMIERDPALTYKDSVPQLIDDQALHGGKQRPNNSRIGKPLVEPKPSPIPATTDAELADALRSQARDIAEPYAKASDRAYNNRSSEEISDSPEGQKLLADLAKVRGLAARSKIADSWVLARGIATGLEHGVVMNADGVPLAISKGTFNGVGFQAAIWRAAVDGQVAYATHNHPSSNGPSAGDIACVFAGMKKLIVMAHNGERHEVLAADGAAVPITPNPDDNSDSFLKAKNAVEAVWKSIVLQIQPGAQGIEMTTQAVNAYKPRFDAVSPYLPGLIMGRMGLIRYAGPVTAAGIDAKGFNFGDIYGSVSGNGRAGLGRAGFTLAPERGAGGNRPADGARKPASDDQGPAAKPAGDAGKGNGNGRDGAPVKKTPAQLAIERLYGKENDDVSGPGPRVESDRGNAGSENGVGNENVSPPAGSDGRGNSGGTGQADQGDGQSDTGGGVPGGDASALGIGGDSGVQRPVRAPRKLAAGGNGGRRDGNSGGGLPAGQAGATNPAPTSSGPAPLLSPEAAADLAKRLNDLLGEDVAGFNEDSSGVDPRKYDAVKAMLDTALGDADLSQLDPVEQFVAVMEPLQAALSRKAMEGLIPILEKYLGARAAGRVAPVESKPAQTEIEDAAARQAKADRIKVIPGDEANIAATLPLLLPEQHGDVLKIEARFAKPDGHGMMITNGTGTGKTYTGMGAIKRFVQAGKGSVLIVAPSDAVILGWQKTADAMGVTINQLVDTNDAGRGVTITTYANLQQNDALANRQWDMVVTDEAQNLSSNADGGATGSLRNMRAITNRPGDLAQKSRMIHAADWAKFDDMKSGDAKSAVFNRLIEREKADVARFATQPRAKVLFLSATPFAYDKSIDYAEGYLFNYPKDGRIGNSNQGGREKFMVENFGYRIRYHKLTKPESAVDSAVFEREFHEKMRRDGVLSGRALQVDVDYDRKFSLVHDAVGTKIDAILDHISKGQSSPDKSLQEGYRTLDKLVSQNFVYHKRMQLLEAIKAKAAIPDIRKHLALGRKVVVFHDFNVGGGTNPFVGLGIAEDDNALKAMADLMVAHPDIEKMDFRSYGAPMVAIPGALGKTAAVFNGTVSKKDRAKALVDFNRDDSGVDVLVVQSDAGGAGISMHDLTGKHQRVLINLGMPTKPTTTLQEEGRILRVGTKTNAAFRYYTIGTNWERMAFARRIAERSGTAENLALGNQARAIREGFINSYMDATEMEPSAEDGTGGKALDKRDNTLTPFQVAKTHYFGRMKVTGRRDQREGVDFYPTPEPLGYKMVEWAGLRPNERVLEPSAGDGAIARYTPENVALTMVEPSSDLASRALMRAPWGKVEQTTFEDHHLVNKYHVVVMNPPFGSGGKTAVEHLAKAARHLRDGGRLVALIPTGPSADKHFETWWHSDAAKEFNYTASVILPSIAFERAGTGVMTRVVILDRIADKNERAHFGARDGGTKVLNFAGGQTINDFFDRLEQYDLPARPTPKVDAVTELEQEGEDAGDAPKTVKQGKPLAGEPGAFKLAQTVHALKGHTLYVATQENRVEKDLFNQIVAVAKSHGGYYSAFNKNGAIPGYQFTSEAARTAFLDDMAKPTSGMEETAYHGTPHEFDQFSLDHIGKGEGHQAFGWGLYFASNRKVAEYYKKALARTKLLINGEPTPNWMRYYRDDKEKQLMAMLKAEPMQKPAEVSDTDWRYATTAKLADALRFSLGALADKVSQDGDDPKARIAIYRSTALSMYQWAAQRNDSARFNAMAQLAADDWLAARSSLSNPSRLYTVEVPSPDTMLDWDKPLKDQPEVVKKALADLLPDVDTGAGQLDWTEVPESKTMRRHWVSSAGWQIVDNGAGSGNVFSILRPDGVTMASVRSLPAAKSTAKVGRDFYAESTSGADLYRSLSRKMGIESGKSVSGWTNTDAVFKDDRAASEALRAAGIPGLRYLDGSSRADGEGSHNFVIFDDSQVQILSKEQRQAPNTFDRPEAIRQARAGYAEIMQAMPALRAELDRLDLKRVDLRIDPTAEYQGMIWNTQQGFLQVVIGASLNPKATLYHEVIHALRMMNLFTEQEWTALQLAAVKQGWLEKHDIAGRYPDLTPSEQIEEAIAEEFSQALDTKTAPKGSILIRAFNKIARALKAFRNAMNGAGFNTVESVFGKVLAGEIGGRAPMGIKAGSKRQRRDAITPRIDGLVSDILAGKKMDSPIATQFSPQVISALLGKDAPLVIPQSVVWKANADKHGLTGPQIIQALNGLDNPLMVFDSATTNEALVALVDVDGVAGPVVVAMHYNEKVGRIEVVRVASIHSRGNDGQIVGWMERGLLRYINKQKADAWSRSRGLQLPKDGTTKHRLGIKVLQHRDVFKPDSKPGLSESSPRFQRPLRPLTAQGRAHRNSGMAGAIFIPDRRVWETLTDSTKTAWQRLRDLPGAASDAFDRARVIIQDRMLPLLRAQQAVMRATGKPIPRDQNAYATEKTYSGKVGEHLFQIDHQYTKPIIQIIAASKGRMTAASVGEWLYARHATERNAYIASINPQMPDGGSGMTDFDAAMVLGRAGASPDAAAYMQIGALVDALRDRSLALRENAGLIKHQEAAAWRKQYKFYVPLKGFDETDHSEATLDVAGVGRRYNVRGAESKRALGRESEAFNPLQGIITQAQETAIRAEKNRVANALYELATANPSPALWTIKKPSQKRYFNRTTGLVETRVEDPISLILEPNEMAIKVNGEEVRIMLHDERLARAVGNVGADQMMGIVRALSLGSRIYSMARTTLSPVFILTNGIRDFVTAQFNIQNFGEKDRNRIAFAMLKNWPAAFVGAFKGQSGSTSGQWAQHYKEFKEAGAHVSFWTMENPEAAQADLEQRIHLARGTRAARILKTVTSPSALFSGRDNAVLSFIERTNLAVDNAIRLAAFVEARKAGWPVEKAAFLAKELTVNFNRRGEASGTTNAFFPFFNAAVQGSFRTVKAIGGRRVAIMCMLSVMGGAMNDMVNANLSDADVNGDLYYDKAPEYMSQTKFNMVLWGTGENMLAIPMPYGYNVFPYMGQQLGKVLRGVKTPGDAFADTARAMFGSYSPISGGNTLTAISPWFTDPIVETVQNENFSGSPIYPPFPKAGVPDSYTNFPSATQFSQEVAHTLNSLTGGDFRQPGWIDVSPETLDYLAAYATGSAGAFWGRTLDGMAKLMSGQSDQITRRDIPFVREFTSSVGEWIDQDRFYQFKAEVADATADAKAYAAQNLPVPQRTAALAALHQMALDADNELQGQAKWNQSKMGALAQRPKGQVYLDFNGKFLAVSRKYP